MGEEDKKGEESKKEKEEAPKNEDNIDMKEEKKPEEAKAEPSPPLQVIVLKVFMHCEGCARKVRRCLKGFEGVENVITDCKSGEVVVKGEKADPSKVREKVQKKSHRPVELISPIPNPAPPVEEPKKPEVTVEEQLPEIIVVLGVYMHCEACAQEIKKRIQKMKGVESVEPDLKSSQVTVKGKFEPEKLTDYVHKKTGKHASIVKIESQVPEPEIKETEDEKKAKEPEVDNNSKGDAGVVEAAVDDSKFEMKKSDFFYPQIPPNYQFYPPRHVQELYAPPPYPPQMFSDENPNACTVM